MSFFTKHGNTKFVGDWKIGDTEYSLLQTVKPIFDAGVFSIQTTPEGEAITGGVTLQAGTGISLAVDAESKTITINAETGSSYNAGDGISISDNTVSLDLSNYIAPGKILLKSGGDITISSGGSPRGRVTIWGSSTTRISVYDNEILFEGPNLDLRYNNCSVNSPGGLVVVDYATKKILPSLIPELVVTDNATTVNAKKIILGEGLEVVEGETEGTVTIQRKRRAAIEFTVDDLTENKLLVSDCMVGDFVVVDADGVMVIPVIQQIGNDVQIDFTDWTITGTWKVIFR